MKSINNITDIKDRKSLLDDYQFQLALTDKLDSYKEKFDQSLINEIVLWKVNRYAKLEPKVLRLINQINHYSNALDIVLTEQILSELLNTKGIRLPMASTILRFKAPLIYQIYDQRVFRYLYGTEHKATTIISKQIRTYIEYLKDLRKACNQHDIEFKFADRILYQADKIQNRSIRIKY